MPAQQTMACLDCDFRGPLWYAEEPGLQETPCQLCGGRLWVTEAYEPYEDPVRIKRRALAYYALWATAVMAFGIWWVS